jgi:hypothetical protein
MGTRQTIPFNNILFDVKLFSSFNKTKNIDTTIASKKLNYLARMEIKRQLPQTNLQNTTINETLTASQERIKQIVSIILKHGNNSNFNLQTNFIAWTNWSLLRTPEKDYLAASAIFKTH